MSSQSELAARRSVVRQLWLNGVRKPQEIIRITGYPKSTVYELVKKLAETGSLSPRPHPGRPSILTPKKRRHLGMLVHANKAATGPELAAKLQKAHPGLSISTRTIQRNLSELKYVVCRPVAVPLLKPIHIETRKQWGLRHAKDRWNQTIFSDETTFQTFRNTQPVRYRLGNQRPQRPMVKHPYKVHVWGAFSANGPIGFVLFTETMNAQKYCEILEQHLFPNASRAGPRWRFQHDNAPMHTASVTRCLLETHKTRVIDWPANSPDLNPIENLWSILKNKVERQVNFHLTRTRSLSNEEFRSIIKTEWEGIDKSVLLNLANSMQKRITQLLERKGNKINY